MEIEFNTETLWRRDCRDCTHAYYLPAGEETLWRRFLRRFFNIQKKFKERCPICKSKHVKTTRRVIRYLTKKNVEENKNG